MIWPRIRWIVFLIWFNFFHRVFGVLLQFRYKFPDRETLVLTKQRLSNA